MRHSPKSSQSKSPHPAWIRKMTALLPGDRMTLTETEVVARGSTLRSAKMTLWNRSKVLDRTMWFQKQETGKGTVLHVIRPTEGQVRSREGRLTDLVARVQHMESGKWMSISGPIQAPLTRLRRTLRDAGIAASVYTTAGRGYFVLRWRDEHAPRTAFLGKGRGSTRHRAVEAALVSLAVGESVDVDYKPQLFRPVVRRYGLLLDVPFATASARNADGVQVLRITRLGERPTGSPLRPWLARFKRLEPGQSFVASNAALERVGGAYAGLSARLHGLAKRMGTRVSVTRVAGRVTVRRLLS